MNRVPKDWSKAAREIFPYLDDPKMLLGIRPLLYNNAIGLTVEESPDFDIQIIDVALGPLNL
jgi:hypothetical protein